MRITSEETFAEHYVHDLSRGGLFILSDELLSIGSDVEIDLYPPGWSEPLALAGKVVRLADDETARSLGRVGMGIKLEGVPEWTRSRLEALIAQVKSQRVGKQSGVFTVEPGVLPAPPPRVKPVGRIPAAELPASAVWTPEELREAKLLELEDQLSNARARLELNDGQIAMLEQTVAEATAATEKVREEKHTLERELRGELDRVTEDASRLRRTLNGRRLRMLLIAAPVCALFAFTLFSSSPIAGTLRRLVASLTPSAAEPTPPPGAMEPLQLPARDAGRALAAAPPALDAGGVAAAVPPPAADAGAVASAPPTDAGTGPLGMLRVETDRDTGIWVDQKKVGRAPMKPFELSVGNHRLRFDCKVEGRRVMSKPRYVDITEGKETVIEYLCADGE